MIDNDNIDNIINMINDKINDKKEEFREKKKEVDNPANLPIHDTRKHGKLSVVSVNGIGLTENGKLTKTAFFDNLESIDKETYGDILLTPEEARSLSLVYRFMSTGVNSVVPLICNTNCPYKDICPYLKANKAPIGKRCKLEHDLLNYHTARFIKEFDVDPEDHSEIMLIQELSELIIYEQRASLILAKPENASLFSVKTSINKDGDISEEEVEHWAIGLKEKLKNRRLKILDALNATRKAKAMTGKNKNNEEGESGAMSTKDKLDNIIDMINKIKNQNASEVEFEEVE